VVLGYSFWSRLLALLREEFRISKLTLHSDLRRRAASRRALPCPSSFCKVRNCGTPKFCGPVRPNTSNMPKAGPELSSKRPTPKRLVAQTFADREHVLSLLLQPIYNKTCNWQFASLQLTTWNKQLATEHYNCNKLWC